MIISFIAKMLPYMVFGGIVFIIVRLIYNRKKQINYLHEIFFLLFVMFISGLASITILPQISISGGQILISGIGSGEVNLIPFKVFADNAYEISCGNFSFILINTFGNILMFIPFGLFPPLLWHNIKLGKSALIGFFASFTVETVQLFLSRGTDVDDLWLNTLGTCLGYVIYILIDKVLHKYTKSCKIND